MIYNKILFGGFLMGLGIILGVEGEEIMLVVEWVCVV